MGRALKIAKTNTGSGTTVSGSNPAVTAYNQNVDVDIGFPNMGSLTAPVYPSTDTLNSTEYLGVVGGSNTDSTATTTNPQIACVVNLNLADGTTTGSGAGRIVRQKGAHKFLVTYNGSSTTAGSFIVGQAYKILALGNTDWNAVGHGDGNAAVGDEFTATTVGSGNGTAYPMAQCVLSNAATASAGYMSIRFSVGDSTAIYASYITNKWIRDWNGMTTQTYADTNLGVNVQSSENFYPTNFFTDEGTVTWSGADVIASANGQNGSLQLAQVTSVTS